MDSPTRARLRPHRFLALGVIWGAAAWAVELARVQLFSLASLGGYTDAMSYLALERGESVAGVRGLRLLVPALAHAIPEAPLRALSSRSDDVYFAVVRFAIVNWAFLFLTAAALYALMRRWRFTTGEAVLGTLLFFTAMPVIRGGSMPMADPASWFFFAAGVLAIQERTYLGLAAAVALGVFAKESTFLLAVPVLLLPELHRDRLRLLLCMVPAVVAYVVAWRSHNLAGGLPGYVALHAAHPELGARFTLEFLRSPRKWIDLFTSFGLLWLPAIAALRSSSVPAGLRRGSWFVPVLLALIFFNQLNFGRILFLAFPFVIPLAVLGLRDWLDVVVDTNAESSRSGTE